MKVGHRQGLNASGESRRGTKSGPLSGLKIRNCRIHLDSRVVCPGEKISGEFIIDACPEKGFVPEVQVSGIIIQFEMNACVNFETDTKFDLRPHSHTNFVHMLQGVPWTRVYVLGDETITTTAPLPSAKLRFPFSFTTVGNNFPTSFRSSLGSIIYQVMAYGKHGKHSVINIIASQSLYCQGKLDLLIEPSASKPINIERYFSKSFFSKKNSVKANLIVEQTGFLPGEPLPFLLNLTNVNSETPVSSIRLSLLSKVVYATEIKTQTVSTTLNSKTFEDFDSRLSEICWKDSLDIPHGLHPSHGGILGLYYFMQIEIQCANRNTFKSEVSIIIGTRRGDFVVIPPSTPNVYITPSDSSAAATESSCSPTQLSLSLPFTCNSTESLLSLPTYSALSSRRPSMETLPPEYEDAICKPRERSESCSNGIGLGSVNVSL